MRIEAVALDLGHTVVDERLGLLALTPHDESHLMPGAREAMERLTLPIAIWANTRVADANDVRRWLERAGLATHVIWVATSVDAGVREVRAAGLPVALATNATDDLAGDLEGLGIADEFDAVVNSWEIGVHKPARAFFDYALRVMQIGPDEVLFVGNQRNTDIAGGEASGIRTVYLTDAIYRSPDDAPSTAEPTFTIATLRDLPALVASITGPPDEPPNPEP